MSEELPIRQDIEVGVEVLYADQHSRPGEHVFVYFITITNHGAETVQLLSRHWVITQAVGQPEEVVGPGVVGEQPVLEPGQAYRYNSFCPIARPPARCAAGTPSKTSWATASASPSPPSTCACPRGT